MTNHIQTEIQVKNVFFFFTNLPFSTNTAIKSAIAKIINLMNVSNILIQKLLVIKFIIKIFSKLILSIKMWCRFVGVV